MHWLIALMIVSSLCLMMGGGEAGAVALTPGFTFQGKLEQGGAPFDGAVQLRFSLWDEEVSGNPIGSSQLLTDVPVVNGIFTVIVNASEELGQDAFNGDARWLQIETCQDVDCTSPEVFTPRQPVTAAPYALNSLTAPWSGLTGVPEGFADGVDNSGDSLWEENGSDISYKAGKVGVGSDAPHHQLRISGGPVWTSNGWTGSLELDNASAIGWRANNAGKRFGIGHTFGGLYFFNTDSDPGSATSEAQYAMTINDAGTVHIPGSLGIGGGISLQGARFQVNDGRIRLRESATQERWDLFFNSPDQKFYLQENAAYNHLVITKGQDGGIGMGTDSPAARLHVVSAVGDAIVGNAPSGNGVVGRNAVPGNAATAGINSAQEGVGIFGQADLGSSSIGVWGASQSGLGALGSSNINVGVKGTSNSNIGVQGVSTSSSGVEGRSGSSDGVYGYSDSSYGVRGYSGEDIGVYGESIGSSLSAGVRGVGYIGVEAVSTVFNGRALYVRGPGESKIEGNVYMDGQLNLNGDALKTNSSVTVRMDHPRDPGNKYLSLTSVESAEMINVYDGNVVLDGKGEAEVALPDWFEAMNKDFRYQLTPIGGPGVNLHIAQKIKEGRFRIGGGSSGLEVSWQVTGVRNDLYAKANPLEVETMKKPEEKGKYLSPELYGQPKEKGIHYRGDLERETAKVPKASKEEETK